MFVFGLDLQGNDINEQGFSELIKKKCVTYVHTYYSVKKDKF